MVSGNPRISISLSYGVAPSTCISTCEAILNKLSPTELPQPTEEEWKKKSARILFTMAVP